MLGFGGLGVEGFGIGVLGFGGSVGEPGTGELGTGEPGTGELGIGEPDPVLLCVEEFKIILAYSANVGKCDPDGGDCFSLVSPLLVTCGGNTSGGKKPGFNILK